MAVNTKSAVATRNVSLNAALALANNGKLRIYDGTQPADADTAISTQNLLAELTMGATAFASAIGGSATANAIPAANASAAGTGSWYRLVKSDGTTVIQDGSVGTSDANIVLSTVAITIGALVTVTSFVVSEPI